MSSVPARPASLLLHLVSVLAALAILAAASGFFLTTNTLLACSGYLWPAYAALWGLWLLGAVLRPRRGGQLLLSWALIDLGILVHLKALVFTAPGWLQMPESELLVGVGYLPFILPFVYIASRLAQPLLDFVAQALASGGNAADPLQLWATYSAIALAQCAVIWAVCFLAHTWLARLRRSGARHQPSAGEIS